jgi:hypothetical protein
MTKIQNPKQKNNRARAAQALAPRERLRCALNLFGIWNLRFICNLVLGICDFRNKTPRQSHLSLTWLSEA